MSYQPPQYGQAPPPQGQGQQGYSFGAQYPPQQQRPYGK